MNQRAALYLRSSKDRSDVSISAQRNELMAMAASRGLVVAAEYTDVVESAKSEYRPGFQSLLKDLKAPQRPWDTLLLVDTSRLSRRRYVAQAFKHEAYKRGVSILYSKLPEVDPISEVVLEAVFEAMDEVHSLMSREKGLAGMAENVKAGYRAGGRAPRGYRLKSIPTGAVRDGSPVTKSVLEPNEDGPLVTRYLKARALGRPRAQIKKELGINWASTSLVGMEWNALTYAGHTVWNVHNETLPEGGYKGGTKRRPREDWHIKRDTHPAFITDAEAEIILNALESSNMGKSISRARQGLSGYLLTGLLVTPDGRQWIGERGSHYRVKAKNGYKGRQVPADDVNQAVLAQLYSDIPRPEFIQAMVDEARRQANASEDPAKDLRRDLVALNGRISKTMDISVQLDDPAPALRKINELESQRRALANEIERLEREYTAQASLAQITFEQVSELVKEKAEELKQTDRLKPALQSLIEEIELDPESGEFRIHYRIAVVDRLEVASPRGFEPLLPP